MKKLQDLLSPNLMSTKDSSKLNSGTRHSPQQITSSLLPTSQPISNLRTTASTTLKVQEKPTVPNIFYNPNLKNPNEVCPSPAIANYLVKDVISVANSSRNTALDTNHVNTIPENPEVSTTLNSILMQLNNQLSSQPKTLQQLLQQNSVSSVPSQTVFQSPLLSNLPSLWQHANNQQNSYLQSPDLKQILTASLLNTPSQKNCNFQTPNQLGNQNLINQLLANQIAQLLTVQENDKKIQILTELLKTAFQNQNLMKMEEERSIPLSNGLTMNPIKRSSTPINQLDPRLAHKIDATRKELYCIEAGKRKDAMHEEPMIPQLSSTGAGSNQTISLLTLLQNSKANSNTSTNYNLLNQQLEGMTLQNSKCIDLTPIAELQDEKDERDSSEMNWSALEKSTEYANFAVYRRLNKHRKPPGIYTRDDRLSRIMKYKNKISKWRTQHPVNRAFKGRSSVAGKKPRIKGKFVSLEEYSTYVTSAKKNNTFNGTESSYFTEAYNELSSLPHDTSIKEEH